MSGFWVAGHRRRATCPGLLYFGRSGVLGPGVRRPGAPVIRFGVERKDSVEQTYRLTARTPMICIWCTKTDVHSSIHALSRLSLNGVLTREEGEAAEDSWTGAAAGARRRGAARRHTARPLLYRVRGRRRLCALLMALTCINAARATRSSRYLRSLQKQSVCARVAGITVSHRALLYRYKVQQIGTAGYQLMRRCARREHRSHGDIHARRAERHRSRRIVPLQTRLRRAALARLLPYTLGRLQERRRVGP